MTHPRPVDLTEGTVADLLTLMQNPPYPRRGNTYLDPIANPAAGAGLTHVVANTWWERIVSWYFVFTAAAGGGPRQIAINLLNGDGVIFNQTPCLLSAQAGEVWAVSADLSGTPGPQVGTDLSNTGSVTGPAAGATIASKILGAGEWQVQWNVALGGTVAAAELNNFAVTVGGVTLAVSDNPAVVGGPYAQPAVDAYIPAGGGTLAVKAVGAGTGTAVYDAAFTAVPIGSLTAYPQLPNIMLKSSWQAQIAVAGIQAADQLSNIMMLVERYPSNWADGSLGLDYESTLRMILGQ